ncbi:hypothetical protein BaRGS_00000093 [Batillaria attramentaria]|uniref:Uncharacterized protein n=1 Tax=Batillaria attramentaria TaxID=370345 RepID=A0ABD0MB44_9CAEN
MGAVTDGEMEGSAISRERRPERWCKGAHAKWSSFFPVASAAEAVGVKKARNVFKCLFRHAQSIKQPSKRIWRIACRKPVS